MKFRCTIRPWRQKRNLKKEAFDTVLLLRKHGALCITDEGKLLPPQEWPPEREV